MTHAPVAYLINEFSIPGFLLAAARGRRPAVIGVAPFLPRLAPLLTRLVEGPVARGQAVRAIDGCPDLKPIEAYFANVFRYDIFARTEHWHRTRFRFSELARDLPEYAMACKSALSSTMTRSHLPILLMHCLDRRDGGHGLVMVGVTDDVCGLYEAYYGSRPRARVISMAGSWRPFNLALSLAVVGYALAWITIRVRLMSRTAGRAFLAADFADDPRDVRLLHQLRDGGPVVVLPRNSDAARSPLLAGIPDGALVRDPGSGRLGPAAAMRTAAMVVRDTARIFRHLGGIEPQHYFAVATLPYRRARERALIHRYRPRYFWCRNEFNSEHVLRRQEMNRAGGRTLGVQHGSPTHAIVQPMWRYISMDVFYVFGTAIYERHWKETWASDMTVRAVGSFGAHREDYALRDAHRPGNILVMVSYYFGVPVIVDIVRALATAFPDRQVFLQVKQKFQDDAATAEMTRAASDGLANVVFRDAPLFDLFRDARYAFSDPSTVLLEALQFGLRAFFLDVDPSHRACVYRWFPQICVTGPEDAVRRIRDMESGNAAYPRDQVESLVPSETGVFSDVVRRDMGLPVPAAA